MNVAPVFFREMTVAARRGRLHKSRAVLASILLAIVASSLLIRAGGDGWVISHPMIAAASRLSFGLVAMVHAVFTLSIVGAAALSIAAEKDRRTLDFLLATRMSNAEIVLGKLAAVFGVFVGVIAAGLPVMALMTIVVGVDPRLVALLYAALATTAFFVASLGLWVSAGARDGRRAGAAAVGLVMLWWIAPWIVTFMLPKFGIPIPRWLGAILAWVLASGPFGLMIRILPGGLSLPNLIDAVTSMGGLQLLAGAGFLAAAMIRLRSAYRVNTGGDGGILSRALRRPSWRVRPRPDVGDDPVFWRERYTARYRGLHRLIDVAIQVGLGAALAYATYYFARPALAEVWNHGYASGASSQSPPEMNLFLRIFSTGGGARPPVDEARAAFNAFLRFATLMIVLLLVMVTPGTGAEAITSERAKETWTGLIATPLTAREILRSKILAALWRIRAGLAAMITLWTVGLIAGAIHPVGFVVSVLILASATWFLLVFGAFSAIRSGDARPGLNPWLGAAMTAAWSMILPFLVPKAAVSAVLGVASIPFDAFLSLFSYQDVRAFSLAGPSPVLRSIGLSTAEGSLVVAAICAFAILAPAVGALVTWRYSVANFDRLIGRPWREPPPILTPAVPLHPSE